MPSYPRCPIVSLGPAVSSALSSEGPCGRSLGGLLSASSPSGSSTESGLFSRHFPVFSVFASHLSARSPHQGAHGCSSKELPLPRRGGRALGVGAHLGTSQAQFTSVRGGVSGAWECPQVRTAGPCGSAPGFGESRGHLGQPTGHGPGAQSLLQRGPRTTGRFIPWTQGSWGGFPGAHPPRLSPHRSAFLSVSSCCSGQWDPASSSILASQAPPIRHTSTPRPRPQGLCRPLGSWLCH